MEKPNYILKFNDGVLVPNNETFAYNFVKNLLIAGIILMVVLSFLFGEFLFGELSLISWICVVFSIVYLVKNGGYHREKCYSELQFYDEYMIRYIPKRYYSRKKQRKEYSKIFYKDVEECLYRSNLKKIDIFGKMENTYYEYDKSGTVQSDASFHKIVDGLIKFYGVFEPDIDFVAEIESHTPLKFTIQSN